MTVNVKWTDAMTRRLLEAYGQGLPIEEIAAEFKMTEGQINGKLNRTPEGWEPGMKGLVKGAPHPHHPRPEILASRWTVGQRKSRAGQKRGGTGRKSPPAPAKGFVPAPREPILAPLPSTPPPPVALEAPPPPPRTPGALRPTLMLLRPGDCRWPLDNPAGDGFVFCGEPNDKVGPYCAKHHRRAVQ